MTPQRPHRLKLFRARQHLAELGKEVAAFLALNPYAVVKGEEGDKQVWSLRVRHEVPVAWSAVVGDVIHNARVALDLLMVAMVRHSAPALPNYEHVSFVIGKSETKFREDLRGRTRGAGAQVRELMKELKPYKGGDEAFWRLHQLDLVDKHRAIIPVGSSYLSVKITHSLREIFNLPGTDPDETLSYDVIPAQKQFPLPDGARLFSARLGARLPFSEPAFRFALAFGCDQVLDGQPLLEGLTEICVFVDRVCSTCETRLGL